MQCHYIMPVIFLQEISRRQSINLRLAHDARILVNSPLLLLDLFLSFFLCSLSMERKMLGMIPICDESSAPSPPHARTRTARLYFLGVWPFRWLWTIGQTMVAMVSMYRWSLLPTQEHEPPDFIFWGLTISMVMDHWSNDGCNGFDVSLKSPPHARTRTARLYCSINFSFARRGSSYRQPTHKIPELQNVTNMSDLSGEKFKWSILKCLETSLI